MSRTVMWEAKAADGRTEDLVAWVLANAESRADVYRSADGRVVVIDAAGRGLPDAPVELVARPPHVWSFERVPR
jgi:hypothetical protein